jgi:hypothetical protein
MKKIVSKTAATLKTSTKAPEKETSVEDFALNIVEITGGKQFPVGKQYNCLKSGISRRTNRPYAMILVGDEQQFVNPKYLKIVKPIPTAQKAVIEAELEEASSATMLISGTVVSETEKAIKFRHAGWKDLWMPKAFAEKVADNDDEIILLVPRWKLVSGTASDCVTALEAKQELYQSIVDAEEAALVEAAKPKTEVLKGSTAAAIKAKLAKKAS